MRWLEKLEDVAFEADVVLDECNYELLRKNVKKQKPASSKVLCFLPSRSKKVLFRRKMAHKIDDVNKKLEEIQKKAQGYGLQMIAMSSDHASVGFIPTLTDSLSIEPRIMGRDNDESTLVEKLLDAGEHKTVSVLPVMGMGGLGKTTLVRKVFHNVKIEAHFEKRIWVCVSTHFDATTLFKMILESLTRKNVQNILTKEVVLEKVREEVASKRYLLILDDVWNENFNLWDDFMNSISAISPNNGNCILVTTRNGNVASLVGTLLTYRLQSLFEDDCWSIIRFKALSMVDDYTEFEGIGKLIAQRCSGLPLVAQVLGGILRGTSKNEWQSLLDHKLLKFELDGDNNNVMDILKLSYDRLPSPTIKKCFAYCSIFPQDHEIRRREVIELWMAEVFLHDGRGKGMETVGDEIFNLLLQNSLFQDVEKDQYNNITKCRMHDLVHELACLVSGPRTVTVENGISDVLQQPRYVVVSGGESFAVLKQQARFLRTIFFQEGNVYMHMKFRQLHLLKMMDRRIEELLDVIGELKHLRLLDIENTGIGEVPDSIGKLYNLQTLCLNKALKRLPKAIVDLISLRHLHVVYDGIELPPWMGKLSCLQTLPYFKVGDGQGCGVGELGKLNNLKGSLKIQNLERVKDKEEVQDANLKGKANIVELVLEWNDTREGEVNDENVLEGLQPHPSLKSLDIVWYKSKNWPSWTMNMAVHEIGGLGGGFCDLMEIPLRNCKECEEVPMFGHLPQLRVLQLEEMSNVRCLGQSFYGLRGRRVSSMTGEVNFGEPTMRVFPSLERLKLSCMGELREWREVEGAFIVFPCLKHLEIRNCSKLKSFPSYFPTLENVSISLCSELESIPLEGSTSLRKLRIYACSKLKEVSNTLSSLEELIVMNCSEVESISCVEGSTLLRELYISECSKLKEITLDFNTISFCLEEFSVERCSELKSIKIKRGDSQQAEDCINNSLRELKIRECPGLIELPIELFQSSSSSPLRELWLDRLENVERLTIVGIFKMTTFPTIKGISGLRILRIGGFSISSDSFNQHLNSILQENLRSLERLVLYGNEDWECLPDQIQHLTSLTFLNLNDFGRIEALPEWIRNLSSLEDLWIENCKSLRHLPSKDAMLSLTKLNTLYIDRSPLLAERCRKPWRKYFAATTTDASSSEWHKIKHIKDVMINYDDTPTSFRR